MTKYFLILEKTLVKGVSDGDGFGLVSEAFRYIGSKWIEMDRNEINDRLMGYDPSEPAMYGIGNIDITEEIREISEAEAKEYMKKIDDNTSAE